MNTAAQQQADEPLDHSVFEADIEGQAMNMQYLRRILGWVRPHRNLALGSIALVLMASTLAIMMPVVVSRVVIDGVIMGEPNALLPDFGLNALNQWLSEVSGLAPLASACLIFAALTVACHTLYHLHRVSFAKTVLSSLRDMRHDLFAHMERRPSSFYDRVAVGRVMTRITNDVQALFELLMGLGMLIGEFVPFFLGLAIMLAIDVELTLYLLIAVPVFGVITYFFRQATRRVYRVIRNTVSQLNQNLQENLSGMQVVQLSNREARNLSTYREINAENRGRELHAIKLESSYGSFMDNMVNMALAVIVWVGGGSALQETISLGSVILFSQFVDMFIRPIRVLGQQYNILFRAMASAERIFQALDWHEQVAEPEEPVRLPARLQGKLEFRHLTFGYDPKEPVLHDVSFTIQPAGCSAVSTTSRTTRSFWTVSTSTGYRRRTCVRVLAWFYRTSTSSRAASWTTSTWAILRSVGKMPSGRRRWCTRMLSSKAFPVAMTNNSSNGARTCHRASASSWLSLGSWQRIRRS
jgi:ATP-binding cassette subfamily B protein